MPRRGTGALVTREALLRMRGDVANELQEAVPHLRVALVVAVLLAGAVADLVAVAVARGSRTAAVLREG